MKVAELNIYPIKSTCQVSLEKSMVLPTGLKHDRKWLLINEKEEMISARVYPKLLRVGAWVEEQGLRIEALGENLVFQEESNGQELNFKFFSERLSGKHFSNVADQWFSEYLGVKCQLIHQKEVPRPMLEKRGGKTGDQVNYGDEAPILLIGSGSLEDLNHRLSTPVSMRHFRPNIVLEGTLPYAEDGWKMIRIGACEFEVAQVCRRCVFTTIDPLTQEKDNKGEPLRTLSEYRKVAGGGVAFGVHLIPRKLGEIHVRDEITLVS